MSDSKCFCHFNGYEVKDAKAREKIEEIKKQLDALMVDAPENFDTFKELSEWINAHGATALSMAQSIESNTNRLNGLQNAEYQNYLSIKAIKEKKFYHHDISLIYSTAADEVSGRATAHGHFALSLINHNPNPYTVINPLGNENENPLINDVKSGLSVSGFLLYTYTGNDGTAIGPIMHYLPIVTAVIEREGVGDGDSYAGKHLFAFVNAVWAGTTIPTDRANLDALVMPPLKDADGVVHNTNRIILTNLPNIYTANINIDNVTEISFADTSSNSGNDNQGDWWG